VSIAVMNWVWIHSQTSGNERLVLLALADACSRDDGTGCWPSAATIARKAAISDRTVRRVIARLEQDGRVLVHRGGGRAGATNSYTVVMDIHSPGHTVTPDRLSGVSPVSGEGGHACQGTPVTAASPDPPENHQGTTITRARDSRAAANATGRGGGGAEQFFAALGEAWPLAAAQRRRLTPLVDHAIGDGWQPRQLAAHVGANADGVRNAYAVLRTRLAELPAPQPAAAARPSWCGSSGCDERTRIREDSDGRPFRCPRCHPQASRPTPGQEPSRIPAGGEPR
jgi:Helix-turn-helix domain